MREVNIARLNSTDIGKDHTWFLHYTSFNKDLLDSFNKYAKGRLLDIGCGNKPYSNALSTVVTEYIGCDIVQSSENCVDILCPANAIPLNDASFDTILSTQTIEHVEDHQGLVNEAYRLLKNKGSFILSGPMYWPLHEEPYDFFRFTKHGFKYILEKAGFTIVSVKPNGGKWSVAGLALLNAIYPDVYKVRGFKGKIVRTGLKMIGGIKAINKLFLYLDSKDTDYSNTINYVIVAEKIVS